MIEQSDLAVPAKSIEAVRLSELLLQPCPINPDWILEGEPEARIAEWSRSTDGTTTTNVWDCTAGRFRWFFAVDEIVHIMDGSVTVSSENHPARTLVVGDAALFRAGTWSEWHVPTYVRKHAILRRHMPRSILLALEFADHVRGALRRVEGLGRKKSMATESTRL
ncbi:cupin domain-containing protein [Rhodococcus sp. G-MC3]|uniref:cupin domain-containing protein n=1 Tax=Rhodococcus sp. G-MC3 TaxID=3046209 RepID=UPI0024BBDCDC|nr:cupin domain-containing protein [Rhodococcus sp. G-MC3]MDJ0394464.1 cupin domain-containing protein [Rhodococcus sp. G-MC3]